MRFRFSRKLLFAFVLVLAAAASVYAAIVPTIVSFGTADFVEELGGPGDLTFLSLSIGAGDATFWHTHPGNVYAVIRSGAITDETACGGSVTYGVGQAFVDLAADFLEPLVGGLRQALHALDEVFGVGRETLA